MIQTNFSLKVITSITICKIFNYVKDLGVTIDKDLIFNTHINNFAHHAHYRAYAINKCFVSRDRSTLLRAFITYVRPLLEYASPVWSPQSAGLIKPLNRFNVLLQPV